MRQHGSFFALLLFALPFAGCTSNGSSPCSAIPGAASCSLTELSNSAAAPTVIAFSSGSTTAISGFALQADGYSKPIWTLTGRQTELKIGHGIALAPNGSIYALAGGSGERLRLLHFATTAGNAKPEDAWTFPSDVLADFTDGLVVDGHHRVWISANGMVRAYIPKKHSLRQVAAFAPKIATGIGFQQATPHAIISDGRDHLYCVVNYLYHGTNFVGASEYDVTASRSTSLMRSFFDPNFVFDVPPDAIAMDGKGYLYLANTLNLSGIVVYPPRWNKNGRQGAVRTIGHGTQGFGTGFIASLAALRDGTLYVAMGDSNLHGSSIVVFPPGAAGNPAPIRTVRNSTLIQYPEGNFGSLLILNVSQ